MIYNGVELYEKGGKVGVLYSPGYGAGWSTWNTPQLAYDKRLVDWWIQFDKEKLYSENSKSRFDRDWEPEVQAALKSMGYKNVYCGGFDQIELAWVPKGAFFKIREYDGSEYIEFFKEEAWEKFPEEDA